MKKFIVKYKDIEKIFGEFASKEEASDKVMEFINGHYISPFDFELEEVECNDVNKVITDFERARKALGFNPNSDFTVVKRSHYENTIQLKDVTKLVNEIAPKHLEALIALNELFAIAEAWNKADGFVPDFLDIKQKSGFLSLSMTKMLRGSCIFIRISCVRLLLRLSVKGFALRQVNAPNNSASNSPTFIIKYFFLNELNF